MANRCYANVQDIKDTLGITASTDDTLIRKIAEAGTALIEKYTGRKFNIEYATKYFTGANRLWVNDLLSISTIKLDEDANASFEATLTTSDYVLFPLNDYPKSYMEVSDYGDYGTFANGVKRGVEIIGEWGYGDGESASSYIKESTTTASLGATATTVYMVSANLAMGQTWLVDSEQIYAKFITGSTARVERGINGTTAAAHDASSDINVYQYPSDVWAACLNLAVAEYQNRDKKGLQSEGLGDYRYSLDKSALNSILTDSIPSGLRKMQV